MLWSHQKVEGSLSGHAQYHSVLIVQWHGAMCMRLYRFTQVSSTAPSDFEEAPEHDQEHVAVTVGPRPQTNWGSLNT